MTKEEILYSINDTEFIEIVNKSYSKYDVCKNLNLPRNGKFAHLVGERVSKLNLQFNPRYKHPHIIKLCPVCNSKFETYNGSRGEQITCSHSCSNTYFRSGINNGMYHKHSNGQKHYRTKCFLYHKKQCLLCDESRIVEVHHLDENHNNNSKDNLIPLCPTHHSLIHTNKYKQEITDLINMKL